MDLEVQGFCSHADITCPHGYAAYGAALVALAPRPVDGSPLVVDEAFFARMLGPEVSIARSTVEADVLQSVFEFAALEDGGSGQYSGGTAPPTGAHV